MGDTKGRDRRVKGTLARHERQEQKAKRQMCKTQKANLQESEWRLARQGKGSKADPVYMHGLHEQGEALQGGVQDLRRGVRWKSIIEMCR